MERSVWVRLKPLLSLILLAPLIAEYLLGSLTFSQLTIFPIMAMLYGAGAVLIRDAARRNGRGWPTILMLGMVFGVIEEGVATQSLFNPDYLGLRLLDNGFIPELGIGAPWTVYVIILHVVWSIAAPIALVEALFPDQRLSPWLKKPGFTVVGIVYILGVLLIGFGTWKKEHFAASGTQLAIIISVAVILSVTAFVLFRPGLAKQVNAPGGSRSSVFVLGFTAFFISSIFHITAQFGRGYLSPALMVGIYLLLSAIAIGAVQAARKLGDLTTFQVEALTLGTLLTYCWLGFFITARLHGASAIPGQFFPCVIILLLICLYLLRLRRTTADAQ